MMIVDKIVMMMIVMVITIDVMIVMMLAMMIRMIAVMMMTVFIHSIYSYLLIRHPHYRSSEDCCDHLLMASLHH